MPLLKFDFDSSALEHSTEPFVKALTNDVDVMKTIGTRLREIVDANFDSLAPLDSDSIERRKYPMDGWRVRDETNSTEPLVWSGELKRTMTNSFGNHFAKVTRGKDAYWTLFSEFGVNAGGITNPKRSVFKFSASDANELGQLYEDFLVKALERTE